MNTCSHGHEEIVHETRNCPLCSALEDIEELQKALQFTSERYNEVSDERDEYLDLLEKHNPELLI